MKNLEHAPMVFNGRTIPMSELPRDIREAEFTKGLQMMLDRGYFGDYPPGTQLFEVMRVTPKIREIDSNHAERYAEVCELLEVARQLETQGLDASEARRAYERALRDHDMLSKLEQP